MTDINPELRTRFNELFEQWQKAIEEPNVQYSSRPQDFIDNEPYREIVALGREALPLIIDKIATGVFFFNQAVAEIEGKELVDLIGREKRFPSEQEKSELLLRWWYQSGEEATRPPVKQ